VTCAPLQNLYKQKRSVSRHFFIELNDILALYLAVQVILNEFCSRFVMAVTLILATVRRSSVGSFVERDFFIRILFQVYFDFA
jgi:hypothetical protein